VSRKFAFLFGVHCHQPAGNFRSVFEKAFADSYRPFLKAMLRHPGVKFTAHYSGPLLEDMQNRERGCWDDLKELIGRGQAELLGGGFYEPILTVIPEEDRQGQLRMMSDFLAEHFGSRPRGVWLTERVWEPSLAKTLAAAGAEYTLVDESHFRAAGVADLHARYLTEEEGFSLSLFPIDKALRYLIPFRTVEETAGRLAEIAARDGLAVLGDDGEKFGLWPGTKRLVYEDGWLERFLDFLERERIPTLTFSEALDSRPAAGRAYLPPASYEEMMDWALEPEAAERFEALKRRVRTEDLRFLRGGSFREFFLKYPESDHLRARMFSVSRRIRAGGPPEALPDLYKAQGNDPYWHGVFGGLYLPHLRESAYAHLLRAEAFLAPGAAWRKEDLDWDGADELVWQDGKFGLFLKPSAGGSLVEIDHAGSFRNLTDVLTRRRESYHSAKPGPGEAGLSIHELSKTLPPEFERYLRCDPSRRRSWVDRFLGPETSWTNFRDRDFEDFGDFSEAAYEAEVQGPLVRLGRRARVRTGEREVGLSLEKTVLPGERGVRFATSVVNDGPGEAPLVFAQEWNFYQIPGELRIDGERIFLCGGRLSLIVRPKPEIWTFPLETLSQSEEGFDIIHQGYGLLTVWRLQMEAGGRFEAEAVLGESLEDPALRRDPPSGPRASGG